MKILTADEMRATDRATAETFGTPLRTLMENAGRAVATFAASHFAPLRRCTLLCGTGNNGGDGFVAARFLHQQGIAAAVLLVGEESKLQGESLDAYSSITATDIPIFSLLQESDLPGLESLLSGTGLLIDAITGTGFNPPLRGLATLLRNRIQQIKTPVLSVDLPSGWDADSTSETVEGAFRSSAVITFTAPKPAHVLSHLTAAVFGPVVVAPIGSPDAAILSTARLNWAGASKYITETPRPINSNKGSFGHVLLVGGAVGKSGAPAMSSLAAMRAGAGLVTAAVPQSALSNVALIAPELMTASLSEDDGHLSLKSVDEVLALAKKKISVLAIGPGLGTEGDTSEAIRRIVAETTIPLVLDADALNAFAGNTAPLKTKDRTIVLTPHPGEMARLLNTTVKAIEADRINIARRFATEHNLTLLLKGWRTLIAHPDGTVSINTSANPSMAKGGSGDILTGIVAALLAQHPDRVADAVNTAAYLHGLAGDFAAHAMDEHTILATDTVAHLSNAFRYRATDDNGFTWLTGLNTQAR